jgi:hypothetical protein
MSNSRIINIENMITKSVLQAVNHEQMVIVMGQEYMQDNDKENYIIIMFCDGGNSGDNTVQIKTTMPDVVEINYLVVQCIMNSGIMFENISATNMDGSKIDMENINKTLKLTVDMPILKSKKVNK